MDITFACEACGQNIVIEESATGQLVDCPQCGLKLEVPYESDPPDKPASFAAITPPTPPPPRANRPETKKCPFCAETIKEEAKVCRFCRRELIPPIDKFPEDIAESFANCKQPETKKSRAGVVLLVMALVVGGGFMSIKLLQSRSEESREEAFGNLMSSLQKTIEEKNLAALKAGKARISMSKSEVLRSLGSPGERRRETDEASRQYIEETWYYGDYKYYVAFDYDGKVRVLSTEIDFDKE